MVFFETPILRSAGQTDIKTDAHYYLIDYGKPLQTSRANPERTRPAASSFSPTTNDGIEKGYLVVKKGNNANLIA